MKIRELIPALLLMALMGAPSVAGAQGRPDPAAMMAAQRAAMARLSFMDGEWRGSAWSLSPSGEKHTLTQTERVGTFLNDGVRVIEGRGYEADGSVGFNAFAIISYQPNQKTYTIRSYAMGFAGDYDFVPREHGFEWTIKAGPMTMHYVATVKDGVWHEVGDRAMGESAPVPFFEMTLKRIGDTDWPAAGAVAAGE